MSGYWHPDAAQTALLQAALCPGTAAGAAWLRWNPALRLDTVDLGAYRLLPLVAENLRQQAPGMVLPALGRITGIQRRHWYANQLLFQHVYPLLEHLQVAGVPVMLLKGMALALTVYPNPGLRPMEDVDILVPTGRAAEVIGRMRQWGWRPSRPLPDNLEAFLWCASSAEFLGPQGGKCDLHWRLLPQPLALDADQAFWQAARPLSWRGLSLSCPALGDLLFHVCVHGAAWNAVAPIRWVADAQLILRQAPTLDWQRMLELAHRHERIPHLRDTLAYLGAAWQLTVPAALRDSLQGWPLTWQQRAEYAQGCLPLTRRRRLSLLVHRYLRWRRAWHQLPVPHRPHVDALRWLQLILGLRRRRDLPLHCWRRWRALA